MSNPATSGYVPDAAEGLAILLWSTDPDTPHRLATPFACAAAAAAMETPVEVYFTAGTVRLLAAGVAANLHASANHPKTVLDWMRDATGHGARLYACSDAMAAHGIAPDQLIAECSGRGGMLQFTARAIDLRWRTMVF